MNRALFGKSSPDDTRELKHLCQQETKIGHRKDDKGLGNCLVNGEESKNWIC